jgi:hypothetical protein
VLLMLPRRCGLRCTQRRIPNGHSGDRVGPFCRQSAGPRVQKDWRENKDAFKKKVSRIVRKSQEE